MSGTVAAQIRGLATTANEALSAAPQVRALDLLNGFAPVFLIAFTVTLIATPLVRRLAVSLGIIDKPDRTRKLHAFPIAYLGGFAVFLGVIAAITYSLSITSGSAGLFAPVPLAVIIGLLAITFTGLADDAWGWDPRLKIAGQLVAAAALAVQDIGTRVAEGALSSIIGPSNDTLFQIGSFAVQNGELYYWVGTALIAIFVLGGCNATNLIDGLDGLLSGTVAIMMLGFLAVSLMMATGLTTEAHVDSLSGARIVICLATLGAVLGFLPWNWNPAVIFLGDCGSLQLGYLSVVVILMFGEQGHTHLVLAGLVIFALPIIDTLLAILRRKLAGVPFSTPDSNHIHHQVRRATGGVKSAVGILYAIATAFSIVGATVAGLVIYRLVRFQVAYAFAIVLFGFIMAIALKSARRQQWDASAEKAAEPGQQSAAVPPAVSSAAQVRAESGAATGHVARAGTTCPPKRGPREGHGLSSRNIEWAPVRSLQMCSPDENEAIAGAGAHGHTSVLAREILELLAPSARETVIDCTAGRGGHATLLASRVVPGGNVILLDVDAENLHYASKRVRDETGCASCAIHANFAALPRILAEDPRTMDVKADVVLADLGFSSSQMDDPSRGFSFASDGPLDMRLDPTRGATAADLILSLPERELAELLFRLGEEPLARRIARKIVDVRRREPMDTTAQLARLVREAYGPRAHSSRLHPATRTFMALRIAVNDELGALKSLLDAIRVGAQSVANGAETWLRANSRIGIITFHSLEDRLVKHSFAELARDGLVEVRTKKPVVSSDAECAVNPRSRSAKLRVVQVAMVGGTRSPIAESNSE